MTAEVCLTVDVEDWYDGMAVLGESFARPTGRPQRPGRPGRDARHRRTGNRR